MHDQHRTDIDRTDTHRTSLIGRDEVVEHLLQLVRRPDVRLVTVTGRSGVGKSVLAAAVAGTIELEDGIGIARAQVDRHTTRSALDELGAALAAPVDGPAGAAPTGRRRTVLLDGLEAAPGSAEVVEAALAADEGLRVLATSVVPLSLPDERVLRLDPLPLPDPEHTTDAQRAAPAVRLLSARVADRTGVDLDLSAAVELSRLLDGLPLALELAAARCAELTMAEVLDQVRRLGTITVLRTEDPTDEPHHRSLRATIMWSYGLLDDEHRRVLRRLGVFAGSFTRADAAAVTGADPGRLDDLVTAGLARAATNRPDRFELVPSVSLVARELLAADDDLLATEDRHAEHFLAVAAASAPSLRSPDAAEVRRELWACAEDLVAAVRHLDRRRRREDALRLLVDLAPVWEEAGPSALAVPLLDELLPADGEDHEVAPRTAAAAWSLAAMVAVLAHRPLQRRDEIAEALARAAALARAEDWRDDGLVVLRSLIGWDLLDGRADAAAAAAQEGLALADDLDDDWWRCQFLGWCAATQTMLGDLAGARALAIEGRDLAVRHGDTVQLLRLSHLLVGISGLDPDEGAVSTTDLDLDLIALARRVDDVHAEGLLRVGRAVVATVTGDVAAAAADLEVALQLARRRNLWYIEELTLIATVLVAQTGGRPQDAARLHGGLESALPRMERAISPESTAAYHAAVDSARQALGDEQFEHHVALGRLLEWDEATVLAAAVCDELAATARTGRTGAADGGGGPLSPRQVEVLAMVARGCTNKEIAAELGMRPKTVMHHTSEIYRRLGVRNRTEAVGAAQRLGLLDRFG